LYVQDRHLVCIIKPALKNLNTPTAEHNLFEPVLRGLKNLAGYGIAYASGGGVFQEGREE
jgi:hypothetical protein